jgi:hypothetical protein
MKKSSDLECVVSLMGLFALGLAFILIAIDPMKSLAATAFWYVSMRALAK